MHTACRLRWWHNRRVSEKTEGAKIYNTVTMGHHCTPFDAAGVAQWHTGAAEQHTNEDTTQGSDEEPLPAQDLFPADRAA